MYVNSKHMILLGLRSLVTPTHPMATPTTYAVVVGWYVD